MSSLDLKFIKNKPYKVNLSYSKYQNFWQKMTTPTTASSYLSELITKLMHLELIKKTIKPDDLCELQMVAVMYGLALNYDIGDLQGMKIKNDDKVKKNETQHPFIQKIISNILKLLVDQEEIIGSVLNQCCFAREITPDAKLGPDVFAYYKSIQYHSNSFYNALKVKDLEVIDTGEFCFTYEYIVKYMNRGKKQITPELIQGITQTIKAIKMSLRESPDSAQVAACAITHVVRQLVTFFPTEEMETLKELASGIETFRKWPLPVGVMADTCFKIILNEMKSPGSMSRDFLRENFPLVDFLVDENGDFDLNLSHLVHCIVEDSLEIDDILNYNNYYNLEVETKLDAHQLRALIVSYILLTTCDNIKVPISEVVSGLTVQEVFIVYTRMLHVLEKSSELDNITECKNVQKTTFNELLKEILSSHQASANKTSLSKVFKENPSLISNFPSALFHTLNKTGDKNGKDSLFHKRSLSSNFSDKKQTIKDQLFHLSKLQNNSNIEKIAHILELSKKPEMPLHEGPVKFMVIGGDNEIYGFVQDLMGVYASQPQLFRRADIKIYIVPTGYTPIAQYMASHDYWYQRYVFVPFKEIPIIPKMEITNKSQADIQGKSLSDSSISDRRVIFPAKIKENLLQSYIREANYKFAPIVYEVKCYNSNLDDIQEIEPNKIIYFFQYIDIGAGVMRYKQRIEKKLPPETPFYELEGNKLIKKYFLDLKIKAEYCEMSGHTHKSEEVITRSIHDLSINNIPREYTRSTLPFPTSGWLEVTYLDFENFKYEDNAMKDKDTFKKLKPEHINAAFSALYTNIHVKRISIWSNDREQTFDFLADGSLCGPCRRIDISPIPLSNHPSGPYFTLPLMTFFPIQM